MSRFVRAAGAALAVLLAFEVGARALAPALPEVDRWREPIVNAKVRRMDNLAAQGGSDVVLAGSSQMLFAGDPSLLRRELGTSWSTYNAALWGAPPVVNEHWLLHVVGPRLHPKTVVFGVSPVDFVAAANDLPVRTYFDALAVRHDRLGSLERVAADHSALVQHRHDLRNPKVVLDSAQRRLDGVAGPRLPGAGLDVGGHLSKPGAFRDDVAARDLVQGVVDHGWVVSAPQRAAFERTVRALRAQGVEVLVVNMAVAEPFIALFPNHQADYDAYRAFLARETANLGVPVLDAAGGVSDTRLFLDFDHVNAAGANIFNSALARALGHGAPGTFATTFDSRTTHSPLAPTLAADVVQRELARAPSPGRAAPTIPATPTTPSTTPSTPNTTAPSVPPVTTPTTPTPTAPTGPTTPTTVLGGRR